MTEETTQETNAEQTTEQEQTQEQTQETQQESVEQEQTTETTKKPSKGDISAELEATRKALEKANAEARDRRHKLKEWEELNVDPDTVKGFLQKQREAEEDRQKKEGEWEELKKRWREETNQEIEKANSRVSEMETKLRSQIHEKNLSSAMAEEGAIPDLLEAKLNKYTEMVEDDNGKYRTVVLDDDGVRTDKTVKQLLNEWKSHPTLGHAFKAPNISGNGTNSQQTSKATGQDRVPKKRRSEMTEREHREFVGKYGVEEFLKLPR